MSFINNREKLFKSKSSTHPAKRVTTGRMKTASSFTDPRAWSLDPRERSSFIMDSMAEMASSSGGEDNCNDVIREPPEQHEPLEIGRRWSKSGSDIVGADDQDLIKLNNKLFEAKEKIEDLQKINTNLLKEKTKTTAEVDNLRVLVTNMKEQMEYLETLRTNNEALRSEDETKTARALEEAKLEIDHLTKEIEIYSGMCEWHGEIRKVQEKLVEEKKSLSQTVNELYAEKRRLSEELQQREDDVAALEVQLKASAQGSLEKSVLRERIAAKDEKIQQLNGVIEKQALTAEDLKETISLMTERFQNKENLLNQEIEQLKSSLEEKTARISQLEGKLHETELLVAELEALRDQFRSTNMALGESVEAYKKDIEKAIGVSEELAETIRKLRSENEAKDREIEKLTLFPQNPDTMLYFSQLNRLVTSAGNFYELESDEQVGLLESIKKVIIKLKTEMWGSNITPIELQIQDSCVQAEPEKSDGEIQCIPVMSSVMLQTSLPDEYLKKVQDREEEVSKLNVLILNCEQRLSEQAKEFDSLESSLFDVIEDNYSKGLLIENADRNRQLLEDTLEVFNKELNHKDEMLARALAEIHEQTKNCQALRGVLDTTLRTTVAEYSEYVGVLEAFLEYKDSQMSNLKELSEANVLLQDATIQRISQENVELRQQMENERNANAELNQEVACLMKSLREKIARTNEVEEKLARAETTIRKMLDNDGPLSQCERSSGDYDQVTTLCSRLAAYKSDLCKQLEAKHALEDQIKVLKNSKRSMRSLLVKNALHKKESDNKVIRMAVHLRKITKLGSKMKEELAKREMEKETMSGSLRELTVENDVLKKERSMLLQELYNMKNRLGETDASLEKYKQKEIVQEELKMKMERMVLKLMKKVTKYKTELNDKRDLEEKFKNHSVMNEQLYHEIDMLKNENLSLSTTICGFEQKLSTLMELPEKESSSVELQVSLEENCSDEPDGSTGIQSHYESIIAAMKKDHDESSEQSYRQYMSNMKVLKDTYERDIANMKRAHADNLAKMQMMHTEELRHQSRKLDWEDEKSRLQRAHADELIEWKKKYEAALATKDLQFEEKRILLMNEMEEMKREFSKIHEQSTVEIENMKEQFNEQIKELDELQCIERELLKRKFEQNVEEEIGKRLAEMRPTTAEKKIQCCQIVCFDKGTGKDIDTKESSTNTDNSDTSIIISCNVKAQATESFVTPMPCGEGFSSIPERLFLLSRIAELEKTLQLQNVEYTRKFKLCEKKLKHEQMKAKEIAHILDQELRYSTDVHCKLGLQYNRAEQLELEKETLASRVLLYEQQIALTKSAEATRDRPAITYNEGLVDAERELEISLNRLKEKIDLAVEQEKRISSVGRASHSDRPTGDSGMDRIPHKEEAPKDRDGQGDMKVIVIQQHKVTHAWSSQIDNVYS